jgi:MerR family transcriptional regulator, thiopeptide resistance regulator
VDRVKATSNWSTAEVARMSGVTSRTLRHYDDIGLLRPAAVAGSGLRYYGRDQLMRLQQILVLRELGLSLDAIATVVNDGGDGIEQLRRHHGWLTEERDRYDRLARTVRATLDELEGGRRMTPEQLFADFDPDRQARYESELVQRYGEKVAPEIAESRARMAGWSRVDAARIQDEWRSFLPELAALLAAGTEVDDPAVQAVIARHYRWVCHFWTPTADSYPGLGQLYAEAPDFRSQFDAVDPRLADFMASAMVAYARASL